MADPTTALEHVLSNSQQLTTWALAVGGGSIALIVSASYRRPISLRWRLTFLLFVPGWVLLGLSLHQGAQLSRSFLAAIMVKSPETAKGIASNINNLHASQSDLLGWSIAFFAMWLVIYLCGWIFSSQFEVHP